MRKTGRNDPCPSGSGKKYKKCCLPKEQQRSVASRRKDEGDELFEDLPARPAISEDEGEAMQDTAQSGLEVDHEPFVSNTIVAEVPEISDAESAIVGAWWTAYADMKDADEIIRHLDAFIQAHSSLVVNLELHHDVLFELGAKLIKAGRASDYIELLQRVRRDFPAAYMKSFGFFDLDIIRYKIVSQDPQNIEDYLNWFEEYPDSDPDNLFGLIDFLMVTECDQPLIGLLEATYYPICRSEALGALPDCSQIAVGMTSASDVAL